MAHWDATTTCTDTSGASLVLPSYAITGDFEIHSVEVLYSMEENVTNVKPNPLYLEPIIKSDKHTKYILHILYNMP